MYESRFFGDGASKMRNDRLLYETSDAGLWPTGAFFLSLIAGLFTGKMHPAKHVRYLR